jgi:hypothetical protein
MLTTARAVEHADRTPNLFNIVYLHSFIVAFPLVTIPYIKRILVSESTSNKRGARKKGRRPLAADAPVSELVERVTIRIPRAPREVTAPESL